MPLMKDWTGRGGECRVKRWVEVKGSAEDMGKKGKRKRKRKKTEKVGI